jgi:2-keto-4-pentenoate hydratase/2-oxohepta-3-ene-1,7-dioic acid hydratase in catechol pathway
MKIVRCSTAGSSHQWGALQDDGSVRILDGSLAEGFNLADETTVPLKWLPPVEPPAIYCIGANYYHHIKECGASVPERPIVFMKGPGTLQAHDAPIVIPKVCNATEVDYEGEFAVVIGQTCKNATRDNALQFVLGYACANDVSARDWQLKLNGSQWCRGKGFDTFLPIGPCLVTADEIPDPNQLRLRTFLNGETMQDWSTGDMVFNIPSIIEFLSQDTTLLPGTVILTGTPHGVGMARKPPRWLQPGDKIEIEIENIGRLSNTVESAV